MTLPVRSKYEAAGGLRYVLSPALDQAVFVASLLREHDPDVSVAGVFMPEEPRTRVSSCFSAGMSWSEMSGVDRGRLIPTGNVSTRALLQTGDVTLGAVTLTRQALRFYDKQWALGEAQRAGVPVPHTWRSRREITAYPVFFKSRQEGGGVRGVARRPAELPTDTENDLLYQEVILAPGTYGVAFVSTDGRLTAAHAHFERESYPRLGGSAVVIEDCHDRRLLEHAERLIGASRYSGWGLVEFKYCPARQDFAFMELNAKLWASCEFSFLQESEFARQLFGIEMRRQSITRMVFLHRAAALGPWALLRQSRWRFHSGETRYVRVGISRALARGLLPDGLPRAIRWLSRQRRSNHNP